MTPFEPKDGERARWRIIYQMLCATVTNEVLSYEAMGDALGLRPKADRHEIQMAMRRAAREHERLDSRAVEAVPNEGYRVVRASEHLRLAQRHQSRSRSQLTAAVSKVTNVDLNQVEDPQARKALQVAAQVLATQAHYLERLDLRQTQLEERLAAIQGSEERSGERLAQFEERLRRLEGGA